jgi:hypothetical protein
MLFGAMNVKGSLTICFVAPKGLNISAQGIALGFGERNESRAL